MRYSDEPVISLDVHITKAKLGGFNINQYDGFAVARLGSFGLFFDETAIPILEQMIHVARSMAPRSDTIRNDSPRIQESEERILPEKGNENNPDEQSGSALDIPFQA